MKKLLVVLAAGALCAGAHAEFKDGNRVLSQMNGDFGDRMLIMGYVTGVIDALSGVTICAPANLTAGQSVDMVKMYLEQNPAIRHLAGDAIVNKVMSTMWPCKKGQAL